MTAITRRNLLIGGAVAGGALAVAGGWQREQTSGSAEFLIERRLRDSAALAAAMSKAGYATTLSEPDIVDVARLLERRWEHAPLALIGCTLASTAFVIEQIATRAGMRFSRDIITTGSGPGHGATNPALGLTAQVARQRGNAPGSWWIVTPGKGTQHAAITF